MLDNWWLSPASDPPGSEGYGIQGTVEEITYCIYVGNTYWIAWDYNPKISTGIHAASLISPALLSQSILTEAKRRFP